MIRLIITVLLLVTLYGCGQTGIEFDSKKSADLVEQIQNQSADPDNQQLELGQLDPMEAPFVVQAPFGEWDDPRFQDACEEASVIMAIMWTQGIEKMSSDVAKALIEGLAEHQDTNYGANKDTSSRDTLERLIKDYYKYQNAYLKQVAETSDLIEELEAGNVIIMPADGQILENPYFSGEGPEKHMLLIKGYDAKKNEFITNDPGTKRGENFRYSTENIMKSLKNYQTSNTSNKVNEKEIIVVRPSF